MLTNDRTQEVMTELKAKVAQALDSVGLLAVGNVKALTPVDTGNLRDSIDYIVDDKSVTIGTNVEYAPYVEFGTSRQKAQPYLLPGIENNLGAYQEIINQTLRG